MTWCFFKGNKTLIVYFPFLATDRVAVVLSPLFILDSVSSRVPVTLSLEVVQEVLKRGLSAQDNRTVDKCQRKEFLHVTDIDAQRFSHESKEYTFKGEWAMSRVRVTFGISGSFKGNLVSGGHGKVCGKDISLVITRWFVVVRQFSGSLAWCLPHYRINRSALSDFKILTQP